MSDSDTTTKTVLSAEMAASMDRAVRGARDKDFCDDFDDLAAIAYGVPKNEVVDSEGYNCAGYDKDGYDRDGFTEDGFGRDGFNAQGFNDDGYDREGFDRRGQNKEGFDRKGRDKYRFDREGWDKDGYDHTDTRRRESAAWYEAQAAKPSEEFVFDRYGSRSPEAGARRSSGMANVGDGW